MLTSILSNFNQIITCLLTVMGRAANEYWIVSVMVAFLLVGTGLGFIIKLAGGRKGRKRRRG